MKILNKALITLVVILSAIVLAQPKHDLNYAGNIANSAKLYESDVKPLNVSLKKEITQKEFGAEYFPLNPELLYKFDSSLGSTKAEFEQQGEQVVLTFDAPSISYQQSLMKSDTGIMLTRTKTSAFLFFGNDISYAEPVLRIPFPLNLDDTWEVEGLETEGGDTTLLKIRGKVLGEELVMTEYGNFVCLKIQQQVSSEGGSSNTLTEWFAPHIGLVKSHAVMEGSGITGMLQDVFGLDEVTFQLVSVEKKSDQDN